MKKLLFVLMLVAFTTLNLNAQCKFLKNEVDEFTGIKSVATESFNINYKFTDKHIFTIFFASIDEQKAIFLKLTSHDVLTVRKEDPLYIKLNNDETIKLYPNESKFSEINSIGTVSTTTPIYYVDNDIFIKISSIGMNKIRMSTNKGDYEKEVKDKDNKRMAKYINCILSNE